MLMAETPNSKSQVPISSHVRDPSYAWWNWIIERCSLFVVEGAVAQISNRLYRRFPIGRTTDSLAAVIVRTLRRLEALRYGRLEICATALPQIRISGFFRVSDFGLRISGSEQFELDIYLESLSAGALVAGTERFFHSKISVPQVKPSAGPDG